jgi:PKD repeat protein
MRNTKTLSLCSNNKTPCYTKIFGLLFFLCIITASCSPVHAYDMDREAQSVPNQDCQQTQSQSQQSSSQASTGEGGGEPVNVPPTASIDAISVLTARPGENISFQGHGTDSDGQIVGWNWSSDIDDFLSGNANFTTSDLSYGKHTISFYVQDNSGAFSPVVTAIVTINNPPTACIKEKTYFGYVNNAISFDGKKSIDQDGTIVSWSWSFGDGATGTGASSTHAYTNKGTYTVTLTVTDNLSGIGTDHATVTIVGTSPIAHAGGPYTGFINQTLELNGSKSSDLDGTIVSWSWDFGDGTKGTGRTTQHIYHQSGMYTITLKVTDNQGCTGSDITSAQITTLNHPPTQPRLNVTDASKGNTTMVLSIISSDLDVDDVYYVIMWGDNTTTTTPVFPSGTILSLSHTWTTSGVYTVWVVALDEHNDSSVPAELLVNVSKSSPITSGPGSESTGPLEPNTIPIQNILAMIGGIGLLFIAALLIRSRRQKRSHKHERL